MTRLVRSTALLVAALLVAVLPPAGTSRAHPPSILSAEAEKATAEEVVEFRKAVGRAIAKKDAAALRKIYMENFTHTHGSGNVDGKAARIASVLAGEPVIENAPVTDLVIRVPGGWTAIATGVSPLRSAADGKSYTFRWMTVYVRIGEGWQIAASQATRLADAK